MIFLVKHDLSIVAVDADVDYEKQPCDSCGQDVLLQSVKVKINQVVTDKGPVPLCDVKGQLKGFEAEVRKQFKARYP